MHPGIKAETLKIKDLASAVDKAAKIAADKNKVQFDSGFVINPWIINGRILREINDLKVAQQVATEIAGAVQSSPGFAAAAATRSLVPTVVWQGGHIICGWIERPQSFLSE